MCVGVDDRQTLVSGFIESTPVKNMLAVHLTRMPNIQSL